MRSSCRRDGLAPWSRKVLPTAPPLTKAVLENVIEVIAGTPQIRDRCMDWHECEGRCFHEDAETCPIRAEIREWGIRTADERPILPPTVSHLFVRSRTS
jgi:hypothetical protein